MSTLNDLVDYIKTNWQSVTFKSSVKAYTPPNAPDIVQYYVHRTQDFLQYKKIVFQYSVNNTGFTSEALTLNDNSILEIKDDILIINGFMAIKLK